MKEPANTAAQQPSELAPLEYWLAETRAGQAVSALVSVVFTGAFAFFINRLAATSDTPMLQRPELYYSFMFMVAFATTPLVIGRRVRRLHTRLQTLRDRVVELQVEKQSLNYEVDKAHLELALIVLEEQKARSARRDYSQIEDALVLVEKLKKASGGQ